MGGFEGVFVLLTRGLPTSLCQLPIRFLAGKGKIRLHYALVNRLPPIAEKLSEPRLSPPRTVTIRGITIITRPNSRSPPTNHLQRLPRRPPERPIHGSPLERARGPAEDEETGDTEEHDDQKGEPVGTQVVASGEAGDLHTEVGGHQGDGEEEDGYFGEEDGGSCQALDGGGFFVGEEVECLRGLGSVVRKGGSDGGGGGEGRTMKTRLSFSARQSSSSPMA